MTDSLHETRRLDAELDRLEAAARLLDTPGDEVAAWLARLGDYARTFLAANAGGDGFCGAGSGPPEPQPLPHAPDSFERVLADYHALVQTRGLAPTSGRFFGYVPGGGIPSAAAGDFVAALTNPYSGVYAASPGAAEIENSAIRWLIEMVGYPGGAWGTLQSGGTLSTLTAVVAARETRPHAEWARGVLYLTAEIHVAIQKSLRIAGLGHLPVRSVPVDDGFRMRPDALARMVQDDARAGLAPWMVFASAGTVNTGAIDPLAGVAEVARAHGLWFHVDAAYGGFFVLTGRLRDALAPMALADSIVLDPHKGLFQPYGVGAVLVRDGVALRRGFAYTPDYLADVHAASPSPSDYSPELTRHFRGARLWMSLRLHGLERFRAALEEKLLLARHAHQRLSALPAIETGPAPELSCVVFRSRAGDAATEALLASVLERRRVHFSTTRLHGALWLRMCVLCFRSHRSEVEEAIAEVERAAGP